MTTHIKPDETWVDVTIYHSLDPELREFNATIVALVGEEPEEPEEIGELGGHLCRTLQEHCLGGATDDLNTETAVLGQVVDDIVGALTNAGSDEGVSSALLINTPRLHRRYRGQRLLGVVVDQVMSTLQLDRSETIVVVQPEPQLENGGPMAMGPARDQALHRLRRHYETQGFKQWEDTVVWWRPPGRSV